MKIKQVIKDAKTKESVKQAEHKVKVDKLKGDIANKKGEVVEQKKITASKMKEIEAAIAAIKDPEMKKSFKQQLKALKKGAKK